MGRLASGKVVLVAGAAPGDVVRVRLTAERRTVAFADVAEVVEPSEQRVEPPCALAGVCGGCSWAHLSVQAQRAHKRALLADSLAEAGVDAPVEEMACGSGLAYRCRVRLHRRGRVVGTMRGGSHEVLALERCGVLAGGLERLARDLAALSASLPAIDAEIELYSDADARPGMWVGVDDPISAPTWQRAARELGVHAVHVQGTREAPGGQRWLVERSGTRRFEFLPGVFVQANREMNGVLAGEVARRAGRGRRCAEVYAGAGNLTVHLARGFESGWAAEPDRRAVRALRRNVASAGGALDVVAERDRRSGRRLARDERLDALVVDPPRSGMRPLLAGVDRARPRRVVMVSCHPAAAVRDLGALVDMGYSPRSVRPIDMFPHTPHLELVALLERD